MAKTQTTKSTRKKKNSSNNSNNDTKSSKAGSDQKQTLEQLFEKGLKEMYNVEKQLIEALPKMAKAAYDEELENAFTEHLDQTKRQAERLEKILERLHIENEDETCVAMEALIEEGDQIIEEFEEGPVRDSALIIGAQKIEHYEMAAYGSLRELADVLGYSKISMVLDRSLEEEEITDDNLNCIAQNVNDKAYESDPEEEFEEVY